MSQIDLNRLIRTLEPNLRVGLEAAASIAARNSHAVVDIAHWLRACLDIAEISAGFERAGVTSEVLRRELDLAIEDVAREDGASLTLSQNLLTLAREAWIVASLQYGRSTVRTADLLVALSTEQSLRIAARGIAPSLRGIDLKTLEADLEAGADSTFSEPQISKVGQAPGENEFLRLYTHDMTEDARSGRIDPVIGRDRELRQVIDVLMRRRQNNPILVGEAGVGKTAVAEALALAKSRPAAYPTC
jgi:type VI secretion system protein VasG